MGERQAGRLGGRRRCVLALGLMLAVVAPVLAGSALDEAREAGIVGERRDGYLGLVVASPTPEQRAFVEEINRKRREAYARIAERNGTKIEDVARLSAEDLIAKAAPGHYVEGPDGSWVRKR